MPAGRVLAALTASVAVGGCAVVVFGMTNADSKPDAHQRTTVTAAPTSRPAFVPTGTPSESRAARATGRPAAVRPKSAAGSSAVSAAPSSVAPPTVVPSTVAPTTRPVPPVAAHPTAARPSAAVRPAARPATRPAVHRAAPTTHHVAASTGQRLPLRYSTGSASRVITVTARSHGSTTATLQAWSKVRGGWKKYGSSMTAHVGAQGIGRASESSSHTPAGGFTLTQAFGRRSDPGTALPYFKTTTSDYWISDAGRYYNTHRRCGSCGYNDGVNERLYYETPYYNYAVVIDYNTRNAPGGVHAGRGSAFFLHVTDGRPTAGCVAIPQSRLVPLMRWLTPSAHPRILIGVT